MAARCLIDVRADVAVSVLSLNEKIEIGVPLDYCFEA